MPAAGHRWLPLAAEKPDTAGVRQSHFFHIRGFGGCDCGGKVVVLGVEAVSPQGVVDRRVLTAGVDASLGLITCERSGFSQRAKMQSSECGAGGLLIPVTGNAVGVEGGDVEQNDGNGSSTSRSGR